MQAMILAAGFGTRLLPHTRMKPKPLFPILNTPLLLLTIRRLQQAGFTRIIVNCHHLREQISAALSGMDGVTVQEEEEILGTGGGLRTALEHMHPDEPLLVTNGDIYHTIPYEELYRVHRERGSRVTLAMHDYPRFNTVRVTGEHVTGFGAGDSDATLAFTGLHVIDPTILTTLEPYRESCVVELYKALLKKGTVLAVHRVDRHFWTDMGTPEDYLALHAGILQGEIPCLPELEWNGEPLQISPAAELSGESTCRDWCSVGRVCGRNVSLERVVVWDEVVLPDGYRGRDRLISQSPETGR